MEKKKSITYKPLKKLIPYARNARTHSEDQVKQIAASIREFGFTNPILIDEEGGIIAGEMTGRHIYAVELNPPYVDVAVKRWQDFTGDDAVHEETGKTFDQMKGERHGKAA